MRDDLRQYHDVVVEAWAYIDQKRTHQGVDVSKSRNELLEKITTDTTPQQFAHLLREFAAALKDGHSEVFFDTKTEPLPYCWPVGFMLVGNEVIVSNLNWLIENPGIEFGDRLIKVNGNAVEELLSSRISQTSASTESARRVLAVDRIHWSDASQVELTFEKPSGVIIRATLDCELGRIDFRYRQQERFCTHKSLDHGITYIRIPSFAWNSEAFSSATTDVERDKALSGAKSEIDNAFATANESSGIILDLRDNGGGFDLLSIYVAQHLVPGNFIYYETERRDSKLIRSLAAYRDLEESTFAVRHAAKPRTWQGFSHFDGEPFSGRLVVLINERCFSSTDNLCAFLQDIRPNTTFVGRATNGGTGEPVVVATLSNCGARIQFCISRVYSPHGRMIEGLGTQPDILVQRDRESIIQGKDLDLEAAMVHLAEH